MRLAAIALCAFLTGCSGAPTLPTKVLVPVATPCITEAIPSPVFITDKDLAALIDYDFIISLARDRLERRQYEGQLEAQIAGCM